MHCARMCSSAWRLVHEGRTLMPDPVDIGSLANHQAAVIDARLHPADIVAHNEEDVRFLFRSLGPYTSGKENGSPLMEERCQTTNQNQNQQNHDTRMRKATGNMDHVAFPFFVEELMLT